MQWVYDLRGLDTLEELEAATGYRVPLLRMDEEARPAAPAARRSAPDAAVLQQAPHATRTRIAQLVGNFMWGRAQPLRAPAASARARNFVK